MTRHVRPIHPAGRLFGLVAAATLAFGTLGFAACSKDGDDVRSKIASANYCTEPTDCVNVGSHCPFGCYVLVNADEADSVLSAINEYFDAHPGEQCMYDCVAVAGYDCVSGKCETIDATQ